MSASTLLFLVLNVTPGISGSSIQGAYPNDLEAVEESVVSVEDELRRELPSGDVIVQFAVALDLLPVNLVYVLEGLNALKRRVHFLRRLLDLTLKQLARVEIGTTLKCIKYSS